MENSGPDVIVQLVSGVKNFGRNCLKNNSPKIFTQEALLNLYNEAFSDCIDFHESG